MTSQQLSDIISTDLAEHIASLSFVKQQCITYMMNLSNVTQSEKHKEYATQMVLYLTYLVNPHNLPVLLLFEPALNQMLLTFVFDISALVKQELNEEHYKDRHEMLTLINKKINNVIEQNYDTSHASTREFNAFLMSYFS